MSVREITEEELKTLIEKAMKSEKEAQFILQLEVWHRQGPAYIDTRKFEVVLGDADILELKRIDEGYPHRLIKRLAVVPKTIPVVIRVMESSDIDGEEHEREEIYVFTTEGWKKVIVKQ